MSYNDLRRGRFSAPGQEYFITIVVHRRRRVFEDLFMARRFVLALKKASKDYGEVLAFVVMPDHVHLLFRLERSSLSRFVKQLKGTSARALNRQLRKKGPFWQPGAFDRALRKEEGRVAVARYIVANPLRARLVGRVEDYPHWDSVWLE